EHHLAPGTDRDRLGIRLRPHGSLRPPGAGVQAALQAGQLLLIGLPRYGGATDTGFSLGETVMKCVVTMWTWVGLVAVAPAVLGAQAQGALKIAFVHSQTILEQTPGYAAADSRLSKEGDGIRDSLQRMQQQWDSTMRAFDQQ